MAKPTVASLFSTRIYRASLAPAAFRKLNSDLEAVCLATAQDDGAGIRWCRKNGYPGYTSYASLNDLPWRYPVMADLVRQLDKHVARFATEDCGFDLGNRPLALDSIWINVLPPGGTHSSHIHPLSVVSGTYYVAVPKGASAIKFEDPRSGLMMAAPPRRKDAAADLQPFIYEQPEPGTLLLWESWLRHEVPLNTARKERISISFNYRWGE